MEYMNFTVKELFDQRSEEDLKRSFAIGIENDEPLLAIPAMNTLLNRGCTGYVVSWLGKILEKDGSYYRFLNATRSREGLRPIYVSADMRTQIAHSLAEYEADPFLQNFGKFLLQNKSDNPFLEFVSNYPEKSITTKQYIIGIHNGRCAISSIEEVEEFKHWYDDLTENMRQNWFGIR